MRSGGSQELSELGAGDGIRIVLDPGVHGSVVVHVYRASGHIRDGTATKVLETLTMTLLTGVSKHKENLVTVTATCARNKLNRINFVI